MVRYANGMSIVPTPGEQAPAPPSATESFIHPAVTHPADIAAAVAVVAAAAGVMYNSGWGKHA